MKATSMVLDLQKAFPQAWQLQWQRAVEMGKQGDRYRHVTASDLEAQVRAFAGEQFEGKAWGSTGAAWGKPYGSSLRIRGLGTTLLNRCRSWLQSEESCGRLVSHNFGRGHISGARYRPRGTDLTAAEKETLERKAERKPWSERQVHASGPLCTFRPGGFSFRRGRARSTAKRSEVTCKACLNLLAAGPLTRKQERELKQLEVSIRAWAPPAGAKAYHKARAALDEMRAKRMKLGKQANAARWAKEHP